MVVAQPRLTSIRSQSGFNPDSRMLCCTVHPTVIQPLLLTPRVASMSLIATTCASPFVIATLSTQQPCAAATAVGARSCGDMRCHGCQHRFAYLHLKPVSAVMGASQCPTAQSSAGVSNAALCRTRTPVAIVCIVASSTSIILVVDVFSFALNAVPLSAFMACAIACTVVDVIKSAMCVVFDQRKPRFEPQCAMRCLTFST